MIIKLNKNTLEVDQFQFKCCIGKNGLSKNKVEGDKKTPSGLFKLGRLFYRSDKLKIVKTKLEKKIINPKMGWCDDPNNKYYNQLVNRKINKKSEKLFRHDYKYDLLIEILYNHNPIKKNKGSAIFLHLTKNYQPTLGCIALRKNDFKILLKLVNRNTYIKI